MILNAKRSILHCDMNNFYASVECMLNPKLKNLPVAVCGDEKERHGIVLAKNYVAKPYGIKVGDTVWVARQKCKDLVIVSPPKFDEYMKYSKLAKEIYCRFTDKVESFGIDECWLDVSNCIKLFGDPIIIADKIRNLIKSELGLTISVGVSFNKVFAKLGSDMKKPDAITEITKENFKDKVWKLKASDLLGVGSSTKKILDKYCIKTIGDIANERVDRLIYLLGKNGELLHNYANGIDDSEVMEFGHVNEIKSIGHGVTAKLNLVNNDEVWKFIMEITKDIGYKLKLNKKKATVISISIRDKDFFTKRYQNKINIPTQSSLIIAEEAYRIFISKYNWQNPVRQITVQAMNLIDENEPIEKTLFSNDVKYSKIEKVEKCIDAINEKYGKDVVKNATFI